MIQIANPIYDSVFKFLVEDERIARTLISALLRKEVEEVHVRRHEYTNGTRESISMFRIDFAAQVREADGSTHLVLIELQKTWLETETLRFRQYLGVQYGNNENVPSKDNPKGYAIPMVAVYLLGHRVGDIEEPVLYVHHKAYDYNGSEVVRGIPDPFVESLTHDSIIVQIPRLRGPVNNRLERVLSVFDQTAKNDDNRHVLTLDEGKYKDDVEMRYILRRLNAASNNVEVRQNMNVEDEFYSAIENRDTAIMLRDEKIKKQNNVIAEQSDTIAEQSGKIAEQSDTIAEQSGKIAEQSDMIAEQSGKIAEQSDTIAEQNTLLKSMVEGMIGQGLPVSTIAKMVGRDEQFVNALLQNQK